MNGKEFKTTRRNALKIISAAIIAVVLFLTARFTRFLVRQKQRIKLRLKVPFQPVQVEEDVFIVRNSTRLKVFSRVCPHLGCKVKLDAVNQRFVCPCHGSQFQLNGVFIKGPAGKNLKALPFSQTDNQLTVTL